MGYLDLYRISVHFEGRSSEYWHGTIFTIGYIFGTLITHWVILSLLTDEKPESDFYNNQSLSLRKEIASNRISEFVKTAMTTSFQGLYAQRT